MQNLKKKAKIEFLPMQLGDIEESFADIKHSIEKLGFKPNTNIKEGIAQFIKWYIDYNGD